MNATYSNFTGGKVGFYGAVGSWEIIDYNNYIGEGNWGVMPWPTEKKGDTWQGLITSAGYVVSQACVDATVTDEEGNTVPSKKGDIAKQIVISFMTSKTQNQLMEGQISLPLIKSWAKDYIDPENDSKYSPSTRSVYIDVISGEHGFFPAKYSTPNEDWLSPITVKDCELEKMWKARTNAKTYFEGINWTTVQNDMQARYDANNK